MDDENDNVFIFKSRQEKWLEKEIVGQEKLSVDNFL